MSFLTSGRPARSSVKVIRPTKPKTVGKRKVYNLFKGYEAINYGYDQEIKRIGPITAASFDEAVEAVYGLKLPLLKRENGKYIDTDGKTIFHKEQFNLY